MTKKSNKEEFEDTITRLLIARHNNLSEEEKEKFKALGVVLGKQFKTIPSLSVARRLALQVVSIYEQESKAVTVTEVKDKTELEWEFDEAKYCPTCGRASLSGPHEPSYNADRFQLYECNGHGCSTHFLICGRTPVRCIDFSKIASNDGDKTQ